MRSWTLSKENKKNKSKSMKKWWKKNKNSKMVKERNKKLSKIFKGRILSEEWKKKIGMGVVKYQKSQTYPIEKCKFCNKDFEKKNNRQMFCNKRCVTDNFLKNIKIKRQTDECWRKEKDKKSREYYHKNRERIIPERIEYQKKHKEKYKKNKVRRDFGLTISEYNKLSKNGCKICGFNETIDLHHLEKGNNNKDKLVCLCPNHHLLIHRGIKTYNEMKNILIDEKGGEKNGI